MSVVAVERALVILKHMAAAPNGVGVREVARTLGYNHTVVQKILQTLVDQDFARQDPLTQHYVLGAAALQVGLAGLAKLQAREVARPLLQSLAESTGETALLGILDGPHAIYVDKVLSPTEFRLDPPLGAIRPLNCTALGKAILAFMPEERIDRLAHAGAFVASTPRAITDVAVLKDELARVRQSGFAVDNEEFIPGAMCLAAPVLDHDGQVIAAVTISGPSQRMAGTTERLAAEVKACAGEISAGLGYRG
jgi:IclR family transcriptional regulator, KDG regulon repressor